MTPHQRYYSPDYVLFFTASITLPIGYTLNTLDAYKLHLSIDQHELTFSSLSELKPSLIILEEEQVEVCCLSPFIVHQINGLLHYNVVATGFRAQENFDVDPRVTAFSTFDSISLERNVAYSCPIYEAKRPLTLQDFVFTPALKEEYLVTDDGEVLHRGKLIVPDSAFVNGLKQYMMTRVLHVPYTLTLHTAHVLD